MTRAALHVCLLLMIAVAGGSAWAEGGSTAVVAESVVVGDTSVERGVSDANTGANRMGVDGHVWFHSYDGGDSDDSSGGVLTATTTSYLPIIFASGAESQPSSNSGQLPDLYYPCGFGPPEWVLAADRYVTEQYEDWWVGEAYCIAFYESARICGWANAYGCVSPTNDHCLFQAHRPVWESTVIRFYGYWEAIYTPEGCWGIARHIYDRAGSWRPWAVRYLAGVE